MIQGCFDDFAKALATAMAFYVETISSALPASFSSHQLEQHVPGIIIDDFIELCATHTAHTNLCINKIQSFTRFHIRSNFSELAGKLICKIIDNTASTHISEITTFIFHSGK